LECSKRIKQRRKQKNKKKTGILLSARYLIWTTNKHYKRKSDILVRKGKYYAITDR